MEMNQKLSFWSRQISALFIAVSEEISAVQPWISAVSEKISAETALFQHWFLALKIFVFSSDSEQFQVCFSAVHYLKISVQSWISAVQRFSGNEQRWNRPEIVLNQSWSALNVSETSTRVGISLLTLLGSRYKKMHSVWQECFLFRYLIILISWEIIISTSREMLYCDMYYLSGYYG